MVYIFSQERGAAEFLWKDIDHFLSSYICSAGTKFFPYIVYSIIVIFHSVLNYFSHIIVRSICFHYRNIPIKNIGENLRGFMFWAKCVGNNLPSWHGNGVEICNWGLVPPVHQLAFATASLRLSLSSHVVFIIILPFIQ